MLNNSTSLLTAPQQRTLSDYAADQLRQAILAGKLMPGQRLVEQDLAVSMQTSRGPVRDALKMLPCHAMAGTGRAGRQTGGLV